MTTKNLYEASHQWATRPRDERFSSLDEMFDRTYAYAQAAEEVSKRFSDLRVLANGADLALTAGGAKAKMTHYAFGQLSRMAGAPANYLRELPTELAAECLNTGIQMKDDRDVNLLMHKNGSLIARALTTESYDRVFNFRVVNQIRKRLIPEGWRVPPARPSIHAKKEDIRPATAADIVKRGGDFGLSIKIGDPVAPAGLYASDHDMFAFIVNEEQTVEDNGKLLARGAFIKNSEVGDGALWFVTFLYDFVCGNHIVWDARQVNRHKVRHIKATYLARGKTLQHAVNGWDDTLKALPSTTELTQQIKLARKAVLGADEDDAIDAAYKFGKSRNLFKLTKSVLVDAYSTAERNPRYGNPRTVWALVNGVTQNSQETGYTDDRNELDTQAGRLMEMAF